MLASFEGERTAYIFSVPSTNLSSGYTNNMGVRRDLFERIGSFLEIPRGADSIFVHQVVGTYSSRVVRYLPDASIRHLEITGVVRWLHKKFLCGASAYRNRSWRQGRRGLTPVEHRLIIETVIHRNDYSGPQAHWLRLLLWMGRMSGKLGHQSAGLSTRFVRATLQRRNA